jgi:hypothetical protein
MALQLNCEEDFYDAMTKPLITLALAAGLLISESANAASWDGTKGNVTISTIGNYQTTVVSVSSLDLTATVFRITVVSRPASISGSSAIATQFITRITDPRIGKAESAIAVFDIPVTHIQSVQVTIMRASDIETFN